MAEYRDYPKYLYHPNAQPAVVSDDLMWTGPGLPPIGWSATPGRAASFPPVQVNNEDQEAYYVSRGYNPGSAGDLKAWESAVVAPKPPGFVQRDYPYFDDRGRLVEDPHKPPPPDPNYPKWIDMPDGTQVIARNAAHERELCPPPPPTGVEAECLALIAMAGVDAACNPVAEPQMPLSPQQVLVEAVRISECPLVIEGSEVLITLEPARPTPDETEDDLFAQAVALGIKIDRRWKRATLQAEIDKALAA